MTRLACPSLPICCLVRLQTATWSFSIPQGRGHLGSVGIHRETKRTKLKFSRRTIVVHELVRRGSWRSYLFRARVDLAGDAFCNSGWKDALRSEDTVVNCPPGGIMEQDHDDWIADRLFQLVTPTSPSLEQLRENTARPLPARFPCSIAKHCIAGSCARPSIAEESGVARLDGRCTVVKKRTVS
jgi:hypothetical protein